MAPISEPHIAPRYTFLQKLRYALMIRSIQSLIDLALSIYIRLPAPLLNTSVLPTLTKAYESHPDLENRIFYPKGYKTGSKPLPIYIDIHGGGFAWGSPIVDDWFCSKFANDNNILVVSLAYPRAPFSRFPVALNALTDLVIAVLEDEDLVYDRKKVAVGGFSAGANLTLCLAQDVRLQGKIAGLVAFYPPVNFVIGAGEERVIPIGAGSVLPRGQLTAFSWGYVEPGQDLRDPRLSPAFADRSVFPDKLYIIGCELDLLCGEAEAMAERLAGHDDGHGNSDVWEKNGIKWEKVLGEDHAFDQRISIGQSKIRMQKRAELLHEHVAAWLFKEVYI